ncbi:hypothetical protein HBI56_122460 [Parastagonospora nodorum]|nr:hypothetical protein HBH53_101140 [Parastagonospora nodorum]KAH4067352.1 hypothetical protein HBH50_138980 [Parastagonospora nodorum]KAH4084996.1 hypothetical protein HBH48_154970 [Parastagonospora nodorum]KAH4107949.1 hypothetical protein HBH46_052530 [Parastagonospora nodorum]KAH4119706.1 hypothetical protein HBH47_120990 [Parastagonospora nodorum]
MKQQASSESLELQVKHARTDDKLPRPIDLTYKLQEACAFFRLPRELRDQIYEETFSVIAIRLVHRGVDYFISGRRSWKIQSSIGLPQWVQCCRQMTKEAIESLARTCSFSAMGIFQSKHQTVSNPLVFRPGHVRSIAVEPDVSVRWKGNTALRAYSPCHDTTAKFLISLTHVEIQEGQLHIRWHRWFHASHQSEDNLLAPEWLDNEPGVWTKDWTEFWTGRFRKVSIDVVVHTNPDVGDASTKFVRLAEMLATRLVGLGGTVTWKDSYTAYPDIGSE